MRKKLGYALVKLDSERAAIQVGAMEVLNGLLGILLGAKAHRAVALSHSKQI